jgi:hypothetical protein
MGITELMRVRPYPVLALSSATRNADEQEPDLALTFNEDESGEFYDQAGHYRVTVSPALFPTDKRLARSGTGAAMFSGVPIPSSDGVEPLVIVPEEGALLSPGQVIRDFSLEFWLFPMNVENGERILSWTASRRDALNNPMFQRIQCTSSKNRLQWMFQNFFVSPGDQTPLTISLNGLTPLVPKTWSHHLIRFDAGSGLLEYLVNGKPEAIAYATSSGNEEGQSYNPIAGYEGALIVGDRFMGMIDELKIYGSFINEPVIRKYHRSGGRAETRVFDLGESNSAVLSVAVSGGKTSYSGGVSSNVYVGNGPFNFEDDTTLQFFIRAADNPYRWTDTLPIAAAGRIGEWRDALLEAAANSAEWTPFVPGAELSGIQGRYVQLAIVFYPSSDNETSPYIDELCINYRPDEPPLPPTMLTAFARNGSVELSWKGSPDRDVAGYLVYYGVAQGEYFGEGAILGVSPLNVGKRTSVNIDGLQNGTLYFFAVAAYDRLEPLHIGMFSREASARPLRIVE